MSASTNHLVLLVGAAGMLGSAIAKAILSRRQVRRSGHKASRLPKVMC